jgi:hypothetical protein
MISSLMHGPLPNCTLKTTAIFYPNCDIIYMASIRQLKIHRTHTKLGEFYCM